MENTNRKTKIPFPQLWKRTRDHAVAIVYWKRVEYYCMKQGKTLSYTYKNPFQEIEMLEGGGFRRVHYVSEEVE